MKIQLAHSPDPDDAFMFYALAEDKIPTGRYEFQHIFSDIETLNRSAFDRKYEVTALSLHAFAYVSNDYWLMPNGASIGKGYGPIVLSKKEIPFSSLNQIKIAIPGTYTTAALALGIAIGKFQSKVVPFDKITDSILNDEVDAGIVIHERQLTFPETRLKKIVDLGEWWEKETGLPLPLGVDAVRKDLGKETAKELSDILEASIRYAMAHEDDALTYAMKFGRGIDREVARKFVRMYVNDRTLRYSNQEKKAIAMILDEGYKKSILPFKADISFELN